MAGLDRKYAAALGERLSRLPADAKPRWGRMNRSQLLGHLTATVRYSMGALPPLPSRANWKSRWIFRPLILYGLASIPRNVRLPGRQGADAALPEGDLESLRRALDEYLDRRDAGALPAVMHPFFGKLSARAWARFHLRHFEHHLKQFGV